MTRSLKTDGGVKMFGEAEREKEGRNGRERNNRTNGTNRKLAQ